MDWILKHKLTAIVIVVLVAFCAWYFFGPSSSPAAVLTASTSQVPAGAQQLIDSLNEMKSITLSGAIFSDPAFQSLQDFSTPITPEPAGRSNPFAPLSGSASQSTTPSGSAPVAQ